MKIDSNDAKQVDIMISKKIEKNNGISIFLLLAHLTYLTQRLIYSNHTHMHVHVCGHTNARICMHTYKLTCTHTQKHTQMHALTYVRMHICASSHVRHCTHTI